MCTIIVGLIMLILGGVSYLFRLDFVSLGLSSNERAYAAMAVMSDKDYRLAYDILTYAGIGVAVVGLVLLVVGFMMRMKKLSTPAPAAPAVPPPAPPAAS
jgi:hypothetical protein